MTTRLGKLIVNTYVLPVITYVCPIWGYMAVCQRKSFQSILDWGLKLAHKVPHRFFSRVLRKTMGSLRLSWWQPEMPEILWSDSASYPQSPVHWSQQIYSKARWALEVTPFISPSGIIHHSREASWLPTNSNIYIINIILSDPVT